MSETTAHDLPHAMYERLRRFAVSRGLAPALALEHLLDQAGACPQPTVGGHRSNGALTAEEIDRALGVSFGAS